MVHSLLIQHMIFKQLVLMNYLSIFLKVYFQLTTQDQCTGAPSYSSPTLNLDSIYFLLTIPLTEVITSPTYRHACVRLWEWPSLTIKRIACCCSTQPVHLKFYSNHDFITQPHRFCSTMIQLLFASRCLVLVLYFPSEDWAFICCKIYRSF